MTVATEAGPIAPGWLRTPSFDLVFIAGIAGIALQSGGLVV
ncbi:MAG: hypothetical protein V3U93_02285 [Alphaproteobacteria bacterium]